MAIQTPIIAGVFTHDSQARAALEALRQAGFGVDQVGLARRGQDASALQDSLTNLGVPGERASYYAQELQGGHTVVSVRADAADQQQTALDILRSNGGYDYDQRTASTQTDTYATGTDTYAQTGAGTYATGTNVADTTDVQDEYHQPRSLRLREERLNVEKERVQSGEVGLHKEVITEQKNIDVPVTHEEVYIERRPVTDGQVDSTPIGQDEVIRVPVSEEQVNVTKNTVVTGEVAVGKRKVEETQQVTDTVRREEARIERSGDIPVQGIEEDQINNR